MRLKEVIRLPEILRASKAVSFFANIYIKKIFWMHVRFMGYGYVMPVKSMKENSCRYVCWYNEKNAIRQMGFCTHFSDEGSLDAICTIEESVRKKKLFEAGEDVVRAASWRYKCFSCLFALLLPHLHSMLLFTIYFVTVPVFARFTVFSSAASSSSFSFFRFSSTLSHTK